MPAKKRIFKEDILDAAINVIRTSGSQALTVRSIAKKLSCSTQPIYSEFGSFDALKDELRFYAEEKYLCFTFTNYKEFATAFLGFAKKEKELFKFLYLRKRENTETPIDDINYKKTIELLSSNLELDSESAKALHKWMQYYCYTTGVMIATDYRDPTDEEIGKELTDLYIIMLRHYKNIESQDELNFWLSKSRNLII